MTNPLNRSTATQEQVVSISSVNAAATPPTAIGLTRQQTSLQIDLRYHAGAVHVIPCTGEQWYVRRQGTCWALDRKLPYNTTTLLTVADNPVEGTTQIGSNGTGSGPLHLNGSQIHANAPLGLFAGNSPLPDPTTVTAGSMAFDGTVPVFNTGTAWKPLSDQTNGYVLPVGGIPSSDLASAVQSALTDAGTAYQLPGGGIPSSDMDTTVQGNLTLASTALQNIANGSVNLLALNTSGTPSSTTFLDGTYTWSTPASATLLQSLLDGLTGITGATPSDFISLFGGLLNKLAGTTGLSSGLSILANIDTRLGFLATNGQFDATEFTNLPSSILRYLNGVGEYDASQLTNLALSPLRFLDPLTGLFDASKLTNILNIPGISQSNIVGLVSDLASLLDIGTWTSYLAAFDTALGIATSGGVPEIMTALEGFLTHLSPAGILDAVGSVTGLSGFLTHLTSGGIFQGLGNIIDGSSNPLSGFLTNLSHLGVFTGLGNILDSSANPLSGYLTHLGIGGIFTGLGNIVDGSSNPLSGFLTNLGATGVFSGLANILDGSANPLSGYLANLTHTGILNALGITSVFGGTSLGADVTSFMTALGSSFPKGFPFTFGTSVNTVLSGLVSQSQFQKLIDGLINNGLSGNPVEAVVAAVQNRIEGVAGTVSQAIIDGVFGANLDTGIARVLQAIPNVNITSILGQANLGADVQAIISNAISALGGGFPNTLAGLVAKLGVIPYANLTSVLGQANIGADIQAFLAQIGTSLGGSPFTTLTGLATQLGVFFNGAGLLKAGTLTGDITSALTRSGVALTTVLQNLDGSGNYLAALAISTITGLSGYLSHLNSSGIIDAITSVTGLGGYLTHLNSSGIIDAVTSVTGLGGYLTNLTSGGVFDAAHLSGAINTALTVSGNALSTLFNGSGFIGALQNSSTFGGTALSTVLTNITASTGALNAAGLSGALNTAVTFSGTALSTLLQYLDSSGHFNAAQLTGALNTALTAGTALSTLLSHITASGLVDAVSSVTGLSGYLGHLNSVTGVLDAVGSVTGLTGYLSHLNTSGIIDAVTSITGLSGYLTHLNTSGIIDAISSVTGLGGYLTNLSPSGIMAALGISSVFGGTSLGADVTGFMTALGSSFPKTFPLTFGSTVNTTLSNLVSQTQFQQLIDGLVGNGTLGNTIGSATEAVQAQIQIAASTVSQAILDGVNAANLNTGIAQVLQAIPNTNITSVLGGTSLGADVQAFVTQATSALGGSTTTLAGLVSQLATIPSSLASLLTDTTWTTFLSEANTALGTAGSDLAHLITGLGAIPLGNVSALTGYLTHLNASGIIDAVGSVTGLSGYLTHLNTSGIIDAVTSITGLSGYLGHLNSVTGVLDAVGSVTGLTGYLTNLTSGGLFDASQLTNIANIPALALAKITGLSSYLTHLNGSTGLLDAVTSVTGLSGYLGHLNSVTGVLDAVGSVTGLSGYLGHLNSSTGVLDAVGSVTGLSGYLTNLTSGGIMSALGITSVFGGTSLGSDVTGFMTSLGSSFPKTFPQTFGTTINTTLSNLVGQSQFQQLIDGLVGSGTNNSIGAAVAAVQNTAQTVHSDISQAILDGVHALNANTGISRALQAFPFANVTSILGNQHLGADVQSVVGNLYGPGVPTYDSIGTGFTGSSAGTFTWTHTLSANATAVVLALNVDATPIPALTALTFGGVPMTTVLGGVAYGTQFSAFQAVVLIGLLNPPTGTQTISLTTNGPGLWAANSVAYTGVGSFGTVATNTAVSGTTESLTVPAASGQLVVGAFSGELGAYSGYSGTVRSSLPGAGGVNVALLIGDAPGATNTSFTVGEANNDSWGAVGIPLIGTPAVQSFVQGGILPSVLGQANLGADVQAFLAQIGSSLGGSPLTTLTGLGTQLGVFFNGAGLLKAGTLTGDITSALTRSGTALTTVLSNLDSSGNYLASLATTQLTGLATGIQTWLASGGALPSATTLAATALSGLGTGIGSFLTSTLAFPIASVTGLGTGINSFLTSTLAFPVASVTGLATGIQTWLSSGGALPSATSILASAVSSVFGGSNLGSDVSGFMTVLGSSFPKTFPINFGTTANTTLSNLVPFSQFQQLLDGLGGGTGNTVGSAIASVQAQIAQAESNISQAILDGIGAANLNTGIAQVLQAIPNANITSVFNLGNLGADVQALLSNVIGGLGGGFPNTLAGLVAKLGVIPYANLTSILGQANLGADIQAFVGQIITSLSGSVGINTLSQLSTTLSTFFPGTNQIRAGTLAGDITSALTRSGIALTTVLTHLNSSGIIDAVTSVTGLSGYLTHLNTSGIIDAVTSVTGLGNYLTHLNSSTGVLDAVGSVTGLTGYLTHLSSSGIIDTITSVTGLSGYLGHLNSSGILDAVGSVTGLPGYLTNLTSGGIMSALGITSVFGGTSLGSDVTGFMTSLGSSFPKTFPQTFGTTINTTLSGLVSQSSFQQLIDGLVGSGSNNPIGAAVAAVRNTTQTVHSDISQAILDGISGIPGGSAITKALQLFPASNVTSVLTTYVAPVYDATGTGNAANPATSLAWSHTLGGSATAIVVAISTFATEPPFSVTVGSAPMTLLGSLEYFTAVGPGDEGGLYLFGLLNPPTGAQTVTATTNTNEAIVGNSLSYNNVTGFGTVATNYANSPNFGTPSLSVPAATNEMVVQTFGGLTVSLGSYNQTQRVNVAWGGLNLAFLMGDAPGAGTVNFTCSGTGQSWGGIAVPLIGIPVTTTSGAGSSLGGDIQALVTQMTSILGGGTTNLAGLISQLTTIPYANLTSVLGQANLGADIQAFLSQIGVSLGGSGISTLTQLGTQLGVFFNGAGLLKAGTLAGDITSALTRSGTALTTVLTHLNSSGIIDAVTSVTGLGSYLTHLNSSTGVLDAITSVTGLGNYLSHLNSVTGVLDAVGSVTGLSGYLTNLTSGGVLALAGLASGALPGTITALISQITDGSSNPLSGYLTNLTHSGILSATGITSVFGGTSLGSDVTGFMTSLGSSFPKTFPQTFGTTINTVLSGLVSQSQFQQLIDGLVGHGQNNPVSAAVAAVQNTAQTIHSDIAQAIQDASSGITIIGTASAITQALQAQPNANILGLTKGNSLGADLQSTVDGVVSAVQAVTSSSNPVSAVGTYLSDAFGGLTSVFGGGAPSGSSPPSVIAAAGVYATTAINNQNIGGLTGLSVANLNQALQRAAVGSAGGSGGLYTTLNFSNYANQSTMAGIFTPSSASFPSGGTDNPLWQSGGAPGGYPQVTLMGITGGVVVAEYAAGYDLEYYPTPTTSDYQVVSMNLGSLNQLGGAASYAFNLLIGRSNTTMGTCVVFFMESGAAFLGCYVGGNWTLLDEVAHTPISGALYELVLGNEGTSNPYALSVLCNGTSIMSLTDSGHISQYGSSYRYAGMGMYDVSSIGNLPAAVTQWGIADNAPPTVLGSGFRAYRTLTGSVVLSSGVNLIPSSYWDTTEWLTADLTFAAASNNKVTISVPGWYVCKVGIYATGGSYYMSAALYKNGSLAQVGGVTLPGVTTTVSDTFLIYCSAGDYLQPGSYSNSTPTTSGEATGSYSYWEVTLANCGTLS